MLHHTNPEIAAISFVKDREEGPVSSHRATLLLRDLLRSGERKPFEMVKITLEQDVTAYVALDITARFDGSVDSVFNGQPALFEGYYRVGKDSDMFHADSVDYEDTASACHEQLEELSGNMMMSGINYSQSLEVLSMAAPVALMTCGSALDYYALYLFVARNRENVHPETKAFAIEAWSHISITYPALTAAIKEGTAS
jgi:hypothetical protein